MSGYAMLLMSATAGVAVWRWARVDRKAAGHAQAAVWLTLRLAALAAVGWILTGPSEMVDEGQPGDQLGDQLRGRAGAVTLLVDTSASMGERDVEAGGAGGAAVSRWSAVTRAWLNSAQLARFEAAGGVRLLGFDARLRRLDAAELETIEPRGEQTHLFAALESALAAHDAHDEPAPVLVVLSDGHDTQRGRDAAVMRRLVERGATVHVVPVGTADATPRLAVQAWVDDDVLLDGETTTLHAQLWPAHLSEQAVEVQLHHEGELVETQRVQLTGDATPEPIAFDLAPAGSPRQPVTMHAYEVRVVPSADHAADDADVFNAPSARQAVFVQVSRERLRVMLLEGEPYWETRWLARVLRDDAQVALHAVYQLGAGRRIVQRPTDGGVSFDADQLDAEALRQFDVIVLGRSAERFFPGDAALRLVDYVREQGGALVLARGRPFDVSTRAGAAAMAVFEPIAPVTWGQQQMVDLMLRVTPAGAASPLLQFDAPAEADVLTTRLPGMLAATRIERERAASIVLLRQAPADDETPGMAAVAQLNAGRGRVLAVLTDGLWRWALLPNELHEYETVYHLFWSRAVRWLAGEGDFLPGQDVSLMLDRLTAQPGEPVAITVSTRYPAPRFTPQLRVIDPAGDTHTVALRRDDRRATTFHGSYQSPLPGVHRVELNETGEPTMIEPDAPRSARLVVADRSPDRLDRSARPKVLAELAEATGGRRYALDEADRLLDELRDRHLARTAEPVSRPAFARWPVLAWIAGCLALEWWLRRRAGLV